MKASHPRLRAAVHTFHIPVMGTGFTIDTPLKVARYGISSVVSLVDDKLIEKIRRHYGALLREDCVPIPESEKDHRALRITAYLNLMDRVVQAQMQALRSAPFDAQSEITRYFELMSDALPLKQEYLEMMAEEDGPRKTLLQDRLREQVRPGSIDVNIMTKADRENSFNGEKLPREYSDAMAALRGYARSTLCSSVVFSAGLNPHLYSYAAEFDDFFGDATHEPRKKVTLKVSDFRSASVQARMLAKKGIWVSEYRIESGLNCGGHAFPTTGHLLGPILEEFKSKKQELTDSLLPIYRTALLEKGRVPPEKSFAVRVTAQGGVGTAAEHQFLLRSYELDSVGWGSPFLLVPEATVVDDETLRKLAAADEQDIYLSHASPLGIPFYNLRNSASEEMRRQRIEAGKPGSPCLSRYLAFNTEFGEPLCVASSRYQTNKLAALEEAGLSPDELRREQDHVLEKSCICRNLGEGALLQYGIRDEKKVLTPAVCPGPNLSYFNRVSSLKEMIQHIYGSSDLLGRSVRRPHVLINELKLYVDYLGTRIAEICSKAAKKETEYAAEFKKNLLLGIEYYNEKIADLKEETESSRRDFMIELNALKERLEALILPEPAA